MSRCERDTEVPSASSPHPHKSLQWTCTQNQTHCVRPRLADAQSQLRAASSELRETPAAPTDSVERHTGLLHREASMLGLLAPHFSPCPSGRQWSSRQRHQPLTRRVQFGIFGSLSSCRRHVTCDRIWRDAAISGVWADLRLARRSESSRCPAASPRPTCEEAGTGESHGEPIGTRRLQCRQRSTRGRGQSRRVVFDWCSS
jgi:hypothetical protein